jgi:hypothetical protein
MERSKIYTILGEFTKTELSDFLKFLKSPYFNNSKNVIKLFELLRPHHPDFSSRVLKRENLHRKIFKGESYSSRSIDNIYTALRKLCEEFMSVSSFKNTPGQKDIFLIEQYKKRKLNSLLFNRINPLIKNYIPEKSYNADQYLYYLRLNFIYADYIFNHMHLEKKNRLFDTVLTDYNLTNKFSYYFKLRLFFRLATGVFSTNQNFELNPGLVELIKDIKNCTDTKINPAAKIFSSIAETILSHTRFDYYSLKKELNNIKEKITAEDFDLALTLLVFYFFPQIDETDSALVRERFEHVKLMIDRKVWNAADGNLKEKNFSLVVHSAIKAGEIEWAENFIKFYSVYIVEDQRDDAINYNMALINYTKGNSEKQKKNEFFDKAIYYLNRFRVHDFTNKLHVFKLKTMIHFDQGQFESLFFECNAFEQFLFNNKGQFNKNIIQSYSDYSKYIKHLSHYVIDENYDKAIKLREKTISNRMLINKDWLSEKLDDFIFKKNK